MQYQACARMRLIVTVATNIRRFHSCDYFQQQKVAQQQRDEDRAAAYQQRIEDQKAAQQLRELEQNISDTQYFDDVLNNASRTWLK